MDKVSKNLELEKEVRHLVGVLLSQKQISQNELAKSLGISPATLSNIQNERWERINESMLLKIKSKLKPQEKWVIVKTSNFQTVFSTCNEARKLKRMVCVVGFTGAGKTTALRAYFNQNPNTYLLTCKRAMRAKQFLSNILKALGVNFVGTDYEMIQRISEELTSRENPLLIIGEASKLSPLILMYLQDLWDNIEDNSGIVLAGVEYFHSNLTKAVERSKIGMPEFFGRVSLWQELAEPTPKEIQAICENNGVTDPQNIKRLSRLGNYRAVFNAVQNLNYNLV